MERTLLVFYYDEMEPIAFAGWLLTAQASGVIPEPLYSALLTLDYRDEREIAKARELVEHQAAREGSSLPVERALDALAGLFERGVSLERTFKILADLRSDGCDLIPASFVGLSSEFDRVGVEPYRERALTEASVLRTKLNKDGRGAS